MPTLPPGCDIRVDRRLVGDGAANRFLLATS